MHLHSESDKRQDMKYLPWEILYEIIHFEPHFLPIITNLYGLVYEERRISRRNMYLMFV